MGDLTTFETIIIAIVEGLTEFLPVSSTGHMIITQNILGVESTEFVKAFTVIIQFGAILSVPLLETVLPVEQHSGACRYFLAEAFAASVRFLLETVGCFYPCGYIGFLIQ